MTVDSLNAPDRDEFGLLFDMETSLSACSSILAALCELLIVPDNWPKDPRVDRRMGAAFQVAWCAEDLVKKAFEAQQALFEFHTSRANAEMVQP